MRQKISAIVINTLAVVCLILLSSCASTKEANLRGAYQLTGKDEGFSIRFPDGKSREIELTKKSDQTAREAMRVLRYSVFISTQKKPTKDFSIFDSPIFLVGSLGKVIHGWIATKFTEGEQDRVEFELRGWFIKVPYIEYPQGPESDLPPPVKRTTLEPKDFKEPIDPKAIHYDKVHRIYWIGVNPFAGH